MPSGPPGAAHAEFLLFRGLAGLRGALHRGLRAGAAARAQRAQCWLPGDEGALRSAGAQRRAPGAGIPWPLAFKGAAQGAQGSAAGGAAAAQRGVLWWQSGGGYGQWLLYDDRMAPSLAGT